MAGEGGGRPYFSWPTQLIVQPIGTREMRLARRKAYSSLSSGRRRTATAELFCSAPDWETLFTILAGAIDEWVDEGVCDEAEEVDLVGFMVDTRPCTHDEVRSYWCDFRRAVDAVPGMRCVSFYI